MLAVDGGVVDLCGGTIHGSIEGWDFLRDVVDAVDVTAVLAISVGAKGDGHIDGQGRGVKERHLVVGDEDRVIKGLGCDGQWCWHWKSSVVDEESGNFGVKCCGNDLRIEHVRVH